MLHCVLMYSFLKTNNFQGAFTKPIFFFVHEYLFCSQVKSFGLMAGGGGLPWLGGCVVVRRPAQHAGVGVGREGPGWFGVLGGLGRLFGRALDPLLQHAEVLLRQLGTEQSGLVFTTPPW